MVGNHWMYLFPAVTGEVKGEVFRFVDVGKVEVGKSKVSIIADASKSFSPASTLTCFAFLASFCFAALPGFIL